MPLVEKPEELFYHHRQAIEDLQAITEHHFPLRKLIHHKYDFLGRKMPGTDVLKLAEGYEKSLKGAVLKKRGLTLVGSEGKQSGGVPHAVAQRYLEELRLPLLDLRLMKTRTAFHENIRDFLKGFSCVIIDGKNFWLDHSQTGEIDYPPEAESLDAAIAHLEQLARMRPEYHDVEQYEEIRRDLELCYNTVQAHLKGLQYVYDHLQRFAPKKDDVRLR
ncbi:MAG: hypothetical protein V1717_01110, partial [Candidatus Micrarchaeota archaeon]